MTDARPFPRANPILAHFRLALAEMYGPRLERVVLYGSRARGDAEADSDYDVAVFLKDLTNRIAESNLIALAVSNILSKIGMVIHAMPFPAGSYRAAPCSCTKSGARDWICDPEAQRSLEKAGQLLDDRPRRTCDRPWQLGRTQCLPRRFPCRSCVHLRTHRQGGVCCAF